jgi:hypothetical protein
MVCVVSGVFMMQYPELIENLCSAFNLASACRVHFMHHLMVRETRPNVINLRGLCTDGIL